MTRDELTVMDGGKCILQLRGVRPFLSDKYDITGHPNYYLTADADDRNTFNIAMFGGTVNDETFRHSKEYFFYISLGIPFYMFGQAMNPVIRADGSPRFAMVSTLAELLLEGTGNKKSDNCAAIPRQHSSGVEVCGKD